MFKHEWSQNIYSIYSRTFTVMELAVFTRFQVDYCPKDGYLDSFLEILQVNTRTVPYRRPCFLPPISFPVHSPIKGCITYAFEKASLDEQRNVKLHNIYSLTHKIYLEIHYADTVSYI
jgi:hypothetical protein